MSGTLFVVATPIGNLEDLSPRAVRVLQEVDLIACEDTRLTRKLLNRFSIATPVVSYHEHNEEKMVPRLIQRLQAGQDVALVSDAGTPLISDPGFPLVQRCREFEITVAAVPGPSAAVSALSIAGLPCHRFLFVGFPAAKRAARKKQFQELSHSAATLIFYLSPHRLGGTLRDLLEVLGNRRGFLVREMTKLHETSNAGKLADLLAKTESEKPRGEYTLIVEGNRADTQKPLPIDIEAYVTGLQGFRSLSRKEAILRAARDLGLPRRDVYRLVSRD